MKALRERIAEELAKMPFEDKQLMLNALAYPGTLNIDRILPSSLYDPYRGEIRCCAIGAMLMAKGREADLADPLKQKAMYDGGQVKVNGYRLAWVVFDAVLKGHLDETRTFSSNPAQGRADLIRVLGESMEESAVE